jgi:hypothetical protein
MDESEDMKTKSVRIEIPMHPERLSCEDAAEILRKKCRYRELILSGRLVLPHARAAQLLGPDSLYHLYSVGKAGASKGKKKRKTEKKA